MCVFLLRSNPSDKIHSFWMRLAWKSAKKAAKVRGLPVHPRGEKKGTLAEVSTVLVGCSGKSRVA